MGNREADVRGEVGRFPEFAFCTEDFRSGRRFTGDDIQDGL
jgi:hypothetical protein